MHDEYIGFRARESLFGKSEQARVFANAREHRFALTLVLDAEQVDHVCVLNRGIYVVGDLTSISSNTRGTNVLGPQSVTFAPNLRSAHMFDLATRL